MFKQAFNIFNSGEYHQIISAASNTVDLWTLTGVLHLHVSEGFQGVLEADAVQLQNADPIVHLLGVGDELVGELMDLIGAQVPTQPVI